jgi:hypothetical protein
MKIISGSIITIFSILFTISCGGKGGSKKDAQIQTDTITVPDTGFTGIKKYVSGQFLIKEVTFKNGVREGLMKSFYQDGRVRMTFWYENGVREDSSRFFYPEGKLFRTTPYKRDTIDGIQKQYYRDGKLKAKIGYKKGLRTTYFEEYKQDGKLVGGYPELIVSKTDNYKSKGIYRVSLQLSDKSTKVRYYQGDLTGGIFDTAHCKPIKAIKGIGNLDLRKTGTPKTGSVNVVAEILTNFGNNYLVSKKIELPYNDLN